MTRRAIEGSSVGQRRFALFMLVAAISAAPPAIAHSYKLGSIEIGHIWAPPSEGPQVAVYGAILQTGTEADRLIAATSLIGEAVSLAGRDGVAKEWSEGLGLEPGEPLSLASFGDHLVVTGVKQPIADGQTFPLTLTFGEAGSITVDVVVEKAPSD
jgi:periplasmic copper chaperone A